MIDLLSQNDPKEDQDLVSTELDYSCMNPLIQSNTETWKQLNNQYKKVKVEYNI